MIAVKALIDAGADMYAEDKWGGTPLQMASENTELVSLFIAKGMDPNRPNSKGADINERELTALHNLAWEGNSNMMEFILARSADIEARSMWGTTPCSLQFKMAIWGPPSFY